MAENKPLVLPETMTPDIEAALSTICFQCIQVAQAARSVGDVIKPKAEAEQAYVIFNLLKRVLAGATIDEAWDGMCAEINDRVDAKKAASEGRANV